MRGLAVALLGACDGPDHPILSLNAPFADSASVRLPGLLGFWDPIGDFEGIWRFEADTDGTQMFAEITGKADLKRAEFTANTAPIGRFTYLDLAHGTCS